MADICLGIDVGTTGLKAVAVDTSGTLVAERTVRYPTAFAAGGAEQDAEAWWAAAETAVPPVVEGHRVRAVAVTCQAPTLVPIDAGGAALGPALTWIDRRATREAAELDAVLAPGRNVADPYFGTAKLLWMARHDRLPLQTAHVVMANGFLIHRLTGKATFDVSHAGMFTGWDGCFSSVLKESGVLVGLLPDAVDCDTVVGEVVNARLGIPLGVPVAAGGIDAVGAALEAGVVADDGTVVEMTGFSTVSLRAVPPGRTVPGMIHTRHSVPNLDLLLTAQVSTGSLVDWASRLTGRDHDCLTALASEASRPGRTLLLPSFAGERTPTWDPRARGNWAGIDLETGPGELLLAIFEGTALALRDDLERCAVVLGPLPSLLSVGGGARNALWLRIKADVLGIPVGVPPAGHGAAAGAALLAGAAVGVWPSQADASAAARRGRTMWIRPDPDRHRAYTARLGDFRLLREKSMAREDR